MDRGDWRGMVLGMAVACLGSQGAWSQVAEQARTPPMGWNSWDAYGTTVNETQVRANADWIAKHLKAAGWTYVVVDMEWFVENPAAQGARRRTDLRWTGMGGICRRRTASLLPQVERDSSRWPSMCMGWG